MTDIIKRSLCCLAALCALLSAADASAHAAATELDRSSYVSADSFVNEPITLSTVMAGLDYGRSAVEAASFTSRYGGGFEIGHHDSGRSFIPFTQTDADSLSVRFLPSESGSWRVLLKKEYQTRARAAIAAALHIGYYDRGEGCWRVYCGAYDSKAQCAQAIEDYGFSGEPYCSAPYCISVINSIDGSEVCTLDYGEKTISLRPLGNGALTDYGEGSYYGSFKLDADTNGLTVINYVDLETYVKGVIPYEMSSSWPLEALKAQAVCARTYAVYNEDGYDHYGFDVTDDTYSQVYGGIGRATEATDRAVDETAGLTVRYEGQLCEIYYSASDGGATEDGLNVFDVDLPYLKGVFDPFEDAINYDIKDWHKELTGEEIGLRLRKDGKHIGAVTDITPTLSDMGNVIALTFSDGENNSHTIRGRWCYNILGLYNCRFGVEKNGDSFVFNGDGWGHNCGMSQYGAKAMAGVYGYNCDDIIRFYFTGAYIA